MVNVWLDIDVDIDRLGDGVAQEKKLMNSAN